MTMDGGVHVTERLLCIIRRRAQNSTHTSKRAYSLCMHVRKWRRDIEKQKITTYYCISFRKSSAIDTVMPPGLME